MKHAENEMNKEGRKKETDRAYDPGVFISSWIRTVVDPTQLFDKVYTYI